MGVTVADQALEIKARDSWHQYWYEHNKSDSSREHSWLSHEQSRPWATEPVPMDPAIRARRSPVHISSYFAIDEHEPSFQQSGTGPCPTKSHRRGNYPFRVSDDPPTTGDTHCCVLRVFGAAGTVEKCLPEVFEVVSFVNARGCLSRRSTTQKDAVTRWTGCFDISLLSPSRIGPHSRGKRDVSNTGCEAEKILV